MNRHRSNIMKGISKPSNDYINNVIRLYSKPDERAFPLNRSTKSQTHLEIPDELATQTSLLFPLIQPRLPPTPHQHF